MTDSSLGVLLWNQATTWADYEATRPAVEELGYDHLWAWDHLYAIFGDPYQPIFEGYTTLAALAKVTTRVRLGLLVGANTFRNPGVVAKSLTTLDHLSDGRVIAGHRRRLDRAGAHGGRDRLRLGLRPAARLAGRGRRRDPRRCSTARRSRRREDGHYDLKDFRVLPRPVQARLPIMIGGSGEKKTLRTVARYADMWNAMGDARVPRPQGRGAAAALRRRGPRHRPRSSSPSAASRSSATPRPRRERVWEAQMAHNRTPMADVLDDDTFWVGTPELVAERMLERKALGFHTFLAEMAAPFDDETLERWITEVKPAVDAAA